MVALPGLDVSGPVDHRQCLWSPESRQRFVWRRVRLLTGCVPSGPASFRWLRSPRKADSTRYNQAKANGAASTDDEWTTYAKGVAFGFSALPPGFQPRIWWLRSPRSQDLYQNDTTATGSSSFVGPGGLAAGVAFGSAFLTDDFVWWLRSPLHNIAPRFQIVKADGSSTGEGPQIAHGVAFGSAPKR